MQKILFLDTETSSLQPSDGEVIEIAGVLVEFDPKTLSLRALEDFSSLIKNHQTVEEKILQLTNISLSELQEAENKQIVHEKWYNWLSKYPEIDFVAGHSVDFDLNFLRAEQWFLPEKAKFIDTLDLAKIFCTNQQAINLEYLEESLNLKKYLEKIYHAGFETKNASHRALYDSQYSTCLFYYFLDLVDRLKLDYKFVNILQEKILFLDFQVYNQKSLPKNEEVLAKEYVQEIDLYGKKVSYQEQPDLNIFLDFWGDKKEREIFEIMEQTPAYLFKILASLYVSKIWINCQQKVYKIHTHSKEETLYLQYIYSNFNQKNYSKINIKYILEPIEHIITKIDYLTKKHQNLNILASKVQLLLDLTKDQETIKQLQKVLSAISFLHLGVGKHSLYGKLIYQHNNFNQTNLLIREKIKSFNQQFQLLKADYVKSSNLITEEIWQDIFQEHFLLETEKNYIFQDYGQNLIAMEDKNLGLEEGFFKNIICYKDLTIQTFLPQEILQEFLELSGLQKLKKISGNNFLYKTNDLEIDWQQAQKSRHLEDFLNDILNHNEVENKNILILTTKNVHLEDINKTVQKNSWQERFLIIGENGGLQKITSKIKLGFDGVCVIKQKDLAYFNQHQESQFSQVWLIGIPFLYLSSFWQENLNSQQQGRFLQIYQQGAIYSSQFYLNKKLQILLDYQK